MPDRFLTITASILFAACASMVPAVSDEAQWEQCTSLLSSDPVEIASFRSIEKIERVNGKIKLPKFLNLDDRLAEFYEISSIIELCPNLNRMEELNPEHRYRYAILMLILADNKKYNKGAGDVVDKLTYSIDVLESLAETGDSRVDFMMGLIKKGTDSTRSGKSSVFDGEPWFAHFNRAIDRGNVDAIEWMAFYHLFSKKELGLPIDKSEGYRLLSENEPLISNVARFILVSILLDPVRLGLPIDLKDQGRGVRIFGFLQKTGFISLH